MDVFRMLLVYFAVVIALIKFILSALVLMFVTFLTFLALFALFFPLLDPVQVNVRRARQ